jgi:hypothetical protein
MARGGDWIARGGHVGKGTQADLLNQRLGAWHLSTGDVFRAGGSRSPCDQSPAMKEALRYMRRGALVPDSTVWEMVRERARSLTLRRRIYSRWVSADGGTGRIAAAVAERRRTWADSSGELRAGGPRDRVAAGRAPDLREVQGSFSGYGTSAKVEGRCDGCDGNCFSERMTGRNRSKSGWRPRIAAPHR